MFKGYTAGPLCLRLRCVACTPSSTFLARLTAFLPICRSVVPVLVFLLLGQPISPPMEKRGERRDFHAVLFSRDDYRRPLPEPRKSPRRARPDISLASFLPCLACLLLPSSPPRPPPPATIQPSSWRRSATSSARWPTTRPSSERTR